MSYNLVAEGDLDLFELASIAERFDPLELFPIPATADQRDGQRIKMLPDALGIAIASSHSGPPAIAALRALVALMWSKQATVHDLFAGCVIATDADLDALAARIAG